MSEDQKRQVMLYAKFIVGAIGSAVTACLGLIPESSTTWTILTIISAVATALGVFFAPYVTRPPEPTQLPAKQ
jgi:hypothetical protein